MEAEAEIYSRALGQTQGVKLKSGRRNCTSQAGQGHDWGTHRESRPELVVAHVLWTNSWGVCVGLMQALCMAVTVV